MPIKNFYTATSAKPGDIFVCVVTCYIGPTGYKLYRCEYPPQLIDGVPQGGKLFNTDHLVSHLFPIVTNLGIKER